MMRPLVAFAALLLLRAASCSGRTVAPDIPAPIGAASATPTFPATTASKSKTALAVDGSASRLAVSTRGGDAPPSGEKTPALMSRAALVRAGCVLAANSGFMNGLALGGKLVAKDGAAAKQAVAAVTGAWTTSALAASTKSYGALTTQASVMASYFGGSMINGLMNPTAAVDWDSPETRAPAGVLLVAAGLVLVASDVLSRSRYASPLVVWCLLALANGVQNSWTSMLLQGNVLRTAHFSGITSDMGSFAGQMMAGGNQNAWKLPIFAALAASFWSGSALSVFCGERWGGANCLGISVAVYLAVYAFFTSFNSKR